MKARFRARFALGAAVAMLAGGVAFAAWTANGTGSGSATATSHTDSSITSASVGDGLYPGATKSFKVTIDNPNDYPSIVTFISSGSSNLVNGSCAAGTVTSDEKSESAGIAGVTATTIAPQSSLEYELTSHMSADPDQACEGQDFTLPLTATLESAAS